jgi:hypothetical protein
MGSRSEASTSSRSSGVEKPALQVSHVEDAECDAAILQPGAPVAAHIARQAAVGEHDIGRERFELVIEQQIVLAVVRRTPFGDAQPAGVEQRIRNPALLEAELPAIFVARLFDVDLEPDAFEIRERIGLGAAFGGSRAQRANFETCVGRHFKRGLRGACGAARRVLRHLRQRH